MDRRYEQTTLVAHPSEERRQTLSPAASAFCRFGREIKQEGEVQALYEKVTGAARAGDIVLTTPESIKSLLLSYLELQSANRATDTQLRGHMASILQLWSAADRNACLLLDEVDMLLHPLHSELNFPVGDALPLSPGVERWDLVLYLLSPLRQDFVPEGPSEAFPILRAALVEAVKDGALQTRPHLLLLEKHYYVQHLKSKFAAWLFEWVAPRARVEQPSFDSYLKGHQGVSQTVSPLGMQLLNLSYEWLDTLLPHVLGKVSRSAEARIGYRIPRSGDT